MAADLTFDQFREGLRPGSYVFGEPGNPKSFWFDKDLALSALKEMLGEPCHQMLVADNIEMLFQMKDGGAFVEARAKTDRHGEQVLVAGKAIFVRVD